MSAVVDAATIATALAVPATGWLFSRISKARQGETTNTVNGAVEASEGRIKTHVDDKVQTVNSRIDDLSRSVSAIDGREQETRTALAELRGRFDERTTMHRTTGAEGN